MTSNIVRQDIASLLDGWIEAERNGVLFPVPLHEYWDVAGHSAKQDAFKLVESRQEAGFDFLKGTIPPTSGIGRPITALFLTVNALNKLIMISSAGKYKSSELDVQHRLWQQLGGGIEVETLAGRVDLLTSTEVIEIKRASSWKEAVGQVIIYGYYYPSHSKRIHLFGNVHTSFRSLVERHCKKLKIAVTWDADSQ